MLDLDSTSLMFNSRLNVIKGHARWNTEKLIFMERLFNVFVTRIGDGVKEEVEFMPLHLFHRQLKADCSAHSALYFTESLKFRMVPAVWIMD